MRSVPRTRWNRRGPPIFGRVKEGSRWIRCRTLVANERGGNLLHKAARRISYFGGERGDGSRAVRREWTDYVWLQLREVHLEYAIVVAARVDQNLG